MKKFLMCFGAMALMFAACTPAEEDKGGTPDFDNIVLDGFYVYGDAVGATEIEAKYGMAAGINEAAKQSRRGGMYEKYIVLEADKDFYLVLNEAGTTTNYGAALEVFDVTELSDNPSYEGTVVKRGELKTGDDAPAMRVDKTGLYHIVLDLNKEGDLLYPQIVVTNVIWGIRGDVVGKSGWPFMPFDAVEVNADTMTWTMEKVEFPIGGKFKFAYGGGWKIQLDDAGNVKANTNLGEECAAGGADIVLNKGGEYTLKLTYKLSGGDIKNSYSFTAECTKESDLPTELYMIGQEFGNWNWEAESVVAMTPVHSHPGAFWAIRYFHGQGEGANEDGSTYKTNGFKFNTNKNWDGAFAGKGANDTGFTEADGNCFVAEDGFYTVYVDIKNSFVAVEPAKVYGIGPAFEGNENWSVAKEEFLFTANEATLVSPAVAYNGNVRMYAPAPSSVTGVDWWQMEFNVFEGKIEYRGAGGDQAAVAITTGQKVTLDFNAGTGSIQ